MAPIRPSTRPEKASKGAGPKKAKAISKKVAPKVAQKVAAEELLENGRVFSVERRGKDIYHILNEAYNAEERKQLGRRIPRALKNAHLLTQKSLEAIGYLDMISGEKHFKECDEGAYLHAMYMGPKLMEKLGLFPELGRIQEIITNSDYQELLEKTQMKKNGVKSRAYSMMSTNQHPVSLDKVRIQLGRHARKQHPLALEMNKLVAKVGHVVFGYAHDDPTKKMLKKEAILNAAFTCDINPYTNSIQINLSNVVADGSKAMGDPTQLGAAGSLHVDRYDAKSHHTLVLMLSHFDLKNHFPGRFVLTATRLACTLEPFGALMMCGVDPHCGLGEGPYDKDLSKDSPLRYHAPKLNYPKLPPGTPWQRVNVIMYPNEPLMFRKDWMINAEYEDKIKALAQFGTPKNYQEFLMKRYIRKAYDADKKSLQHITPQEMVKKFAWVDATTGRTNYPSLAIAKICFDRSPDPNWEKVLRITEKTHCDLPKKHNKIVHPPGSVEEYHAARAQLMRRNRHFNNTRTKLGLPVVKDPFGEVPPYKPLPKKPKQKEGEPKVAGTVVPKKDFAIWTD